jgi:hypothetical protein
MTARRIFLITVLTAAPGILWQSFEMYGLTLRGEQMLFFSIIHTSPLLVLVVFIAVPLTVLVLGQALAAIFWSGYRARLGVRKGALAALAAFSSVHLVLLFTYGAWSRTEIRAPICVFSIVLLVTTVIAMLAFGRGRSEVVADV